MNILGINGSLGFDGNISTVSDLDFWVHGSGATLFIDGELMGSISEERLTRLKHDGDWPRKSIEQLLNRNNLKPEDIDMVGYVSNASIISYSLKIQGYNNKALSEMFPNAKIMFVDHHLAHASASFLTSDFEEANIFTFDGAGDYHPTPKHQPTKLNNSTFFTGDKANKKVTPLFHTYMDFNEFGSFYVQLSWIIFQRMVNGEVTIDDPKLSHARELKNIQNMNTIFSYSSPREATNYEHDFHDEFFGTPVSRETYPGKIMGLSAYGDYKKVPNDEPFRFKFEEGFPVVEITQPVGQPWIFTFKDYGPEDLAAWLQHYFEKYLLMYLENIPKDIKTKNLCLGGGCALNILANSKIISNGIYEDVHVNTAPNDDGLNFGAAILCVFENEEKTILPKNTGCIGLDYNDDDVKKLIDKFNIKENNEL